MPWFQSALNTGNKFANTQIPLEIQSLLVHYFMFSTLCFFFIPVNIPVSFFTFSMLREDQRKPENGN